MKKSKFLFIVLLMIFINVGSKCNADNLALNRIALIEYLILPPMSYSSFYASPSGFGSFSIGGSFAGFSFEYYKANADRFNEILGEALNENEFYELIYGSKLYTSYEYMDLINQDIEVFEVAPDVFIHSESYNFIDFSQYKSFSDVLSTKYKNEQPTISKICKALNVDGAIICYFYVDGAWNMHLQGHLFDCNGRLLRKVFGNRMCTTLSKKNFLETFDSNYQKITKSFADIFSRIKKKVDKKLVKKAKKAEKIE
jgi:hypothetical protein